MGWSALSPATCHHDSFLLVHVQGQVGILVHVPFVLPDALGGPQVPQLDLWEEAQRLVLVSPRRESQWGRGGLHRPLQVRKCKSPALSLRTHQRHQDKCPIPLDQMGLRVGGKATALHTWHLTWSPRASLLPRSDTGVSPAEPLPWPRAAPAAAISSTPTVPAMSDAIRHCSSWRICTEVTAESWNRRVAFQPLP